MSNITVEQPRCFSADKSDEKLPNKNLYGSAFPRERVVGHVPRVRGAGSRCIKTKKP